jgi:hypothetical protein
VFTKWKSDFYFTHIPVVKDNTPTQLVPHVSVYPSLYLHLLSTNPARPTCQSPPLPIYCLPHSAAALQETLHHAAATAAACGGFVGSWLLLVVRGTFASHRVRRSLIPARVSAKSCLSARARAPRFGFADHLPGRPRFDWWIAAKLLIRPRHRS